MAVEKSRYWLVIVIIFVVSWLPLGGFSLIADLESTPDMFQSSPQRIYIGFAIVHVIAMSSAISNPIVYGWLNTNIRQEFLQLMPSRCSRVCAKHPQRNWLAGGATTVDETTRTHVHYEDVKINKEAINLLVSVDNNVHNVDLQEFARL
ncbi:UNVERIFIED_CONTAM: hypothetical protein PYX00_003738 [Menopon gallinae]|uniref:G-protein coupled receptors family 1 profile domain-containing protein n=1 Tax=Menopon gallinae TaxID=328185 RepID=A0AAW2I2W8_9NEOP